MLGDFERGLDFDARGGPRIEDRDGAGEKSGKEVDRSNRNEELRPDRPLIPQLLQHAALQSHRPWPQTGPFLVPAVLPLGCQADFITLFASLGISFQSKPDAGQIAMVNLALELPNFPGHYRDVQGNRAYVARLPKARMPASGTTKPIVTATMTSAARSA
jgi:hypothetical protein